MLELQKPEAIRKEGVSMGLLHLRNSLSSVRQSRQECGECSPGGHLQWQDDQPHAAQSMRFC